MPTRSTPRARLGSALVGALLIALLAAVRASPARAEAAWTTYHHDALRSGVDPDATEPVEPVLAWHTTDLGAPIWGQPLVLGQRVYVATVGDELYALNAVTGAIEWQRSAGVPVPSDELPCGDITPTVGIVGTPVIDASDGVIYLVADTWNAATHTAAHVLEGFRLQDGAAVLSTPVDPPGSDPETLLQRSALNLDQGHVVFGFGENFGSCSGRVAPLVAVPEDGGGARFWQDHEPSAPATAGGMWATSGAAVDEAGDIFATTANPLLPAGERATVYDYSDSVLKLELSDFVAEPLSEPLAPAGWFEPPNWEEISNEDLDLGSAGAEPLPGGLLFQAGKDGTGYLIEQSTMGTGAAAVFSGRVCEGHGSFGGDAFFEGTIYIPCTNGVQALAYDQAAKTFAPLWHGPAEAFGPPIVSGGLVWVAATGGFHGEGQKLYGLDPATGSVQRTLALPSPIADHFASPSAGGGRVFIATGCSVTAYQVSARPEGGVGAPLGPSAVPECMPLSTASSSPAGASGTSGTASSTSSAADQLKSAATKALPRFSATPQLLSTHLRLNARGVVALRLFCASNVCRGTVTLRAKIVASSHGRRSRRPVLLTLATVRFAHPRGAFTLKVHLGGAARAALVSHHDRLTLRVSIASRGAQARTVVAVLK
jgi:polyvinyl alcohol dehydrogenase (cytochrome)